MPSDRVNRPIFLCYHIFSLVKQYKTCLMIPTTARVGLINVCRGRICCPGSEERRQSCAWPHPLVPARGTTTSAWSERYEAEIVTSLLVPARGIPIYS